MPPVYEQLIGLHILLLLAFIGVTSMLMLVTVINRLRVRDVLISWPNGKFFGLPLSSTLFLAVVLSFLAVAALQDQLIYPMIFVGYLMGGAFWFTSSVLTSTILVTPHGVILNVNRNGKAVVWGQVVDYFQFGESQSEGYVFFYVDGTGIRQRLEVRVPAPFRSAFSRVVRKRLASRFAARDQEPAGRKALEE